MPPIHSHYENLKVARSAPLEVIRAAYKALAQKYHPDRNHGDPDAARVMAILNKAYQILSDSKLRFEHDQWIRAVEAARGTTHTTSEPTSSDVKSNPRRASSSSKPASRPTAKNAPTASSNASEKIINLEVEWKKFKSFFGRRTSKFP